MKKINEGTIFRQSLDPLARTAATYTGRGIDLTGAGRALWQVHAGLNGSSGTVDVKIQEGELAAIIADLDASADADVDLEDTTTTELGVQFTTPNNDGVLAHAVHAYFKQNGTVASGKNITCTLQTDSTADPSDTDLITPVNGDIAPDVLASTYEVVKFVFDPPIALTANTLYWAVFETDITGHASNNVSLSVDTVGSGGNVNDHSADWNGITTTQKGNVNIVGVDFTDIANADATQITESNDNGVHLVEVPVSVPSRSGGTIYQRAHCIVGTATCANAVSVMAVARYTPVSQDNTVVSV